MTVGRARCEVVVCCVVLMFLCVNSSALPPLPRVGMYCGNGTQNFSQFNHSLSYAAGIALGHPATTYLRTWSDVDAFLNGYPIYNSVLLLPNGDPTALAATIGQSALAEYLSNGGGLVATGGGATFAIEHLHLYGNPTPPRQHMEPTASAHIQFTQQGMWETGLQFGPNPKHFEGNVTVDYLQGAVFSNMSTPSNVTRWACFDNNATGWPAITSLKFGAGKVVLNSVDLELAQPSYGGLVDVYIGAISWVFREDS